MKKYCVIRLEKIKNLTALGRAYNHNYRTTQTAAPEANASLRYRNEELCDGLIKEGLSFGEIYERRISESRFYQNHAVRSNAVPAVELVMSFSQDMIGKFDIELWKEQNLEWLKRRYGKNLISAMYHDDEYAKDGKNASPHIHAIVLPFDEIEQLNAKKLCGGKMDFIKLQDDYAKEMKMFGLERGTVGVEDKHVQPKAYHNQLKKRIEEMSQELPEIEQHDTAEKYRDKLEDYIINFASRSYQKEKDDEQTITKLKAENKDLKNQLDGKTSLEDILTEKGFYDKNKKLKSEIRRFINEGEDFRPYERLMQYLGLDHDQITAEDVKKARDIAAKGNLLESSLANFSDRERARMVSEELNLIFKEQRERDKREKQTIKERELSVSSL